MAHLPALDDVERVLGELGGRGYAERLDRRPGQKEDRFRQLLGGGGEDDPEVTFASPAPVAAGGFDEPIAAPRDDPSAAPPVAGADGDLAARVAALEADVAALREQLADLLS
jgi:hypothetical protein